jgi:murein DD-endopeptidase MepM/ murein hydrolase activator NlpD
MQRRITLLIAAFTAVSGLAAPPVVAAEQQLADIVVIGGVGAIGPGVFDHLGTCTAGTVTRIAGASRYETAAAIAGGWETADVVYLATGERFPDAIAIGAVAAAEGAPILLTTRDRLPVSTVAAIERLMPREVVIVGGPGAVSAEVEGELATLTPLVTRLAGADRYETAAAISANRYVPGVDVVHVVTGESFADGITAGPAATGGPILLVPASGIPGAVATELIRLDPAEIVVVGGEGAVSPATERSLAAFTTGAVLRISGSSRFATAAAISASAKPGTTYVVRADDYPDGLAVAGLAGDRPILLTKGTNLPAATAAEVSRLTDTDCTAWELDSLLRPVPGPITSGFGPRIHPIFGGYRMHHGIDIDVAAGIPIVAAAAGTVIHSGSKGGYGSTVMLEHGGRFVTLYAHMSRIGAELGQEVAAGETIGWVGSTGDSTGPHLHFEVRIDDTPVDPEPYLVR